jgi:cytoskeletal protein CcmA (bactofilin family)
MKIQTKSTNSQTIIAEDVSIDGDMILSGNVTIYGEILKEML